MKKTDDVLTPTKWKKAPGALADATAKDIKKLEEHLAPLAPELFIWLQDAQICTVESKDDHNLVLINKKASYTINLDELPEVIAKKLKAGDRFPVDQQGKLHEEWVALIETNSALIEHVYPDRNWEAKYEVYEGIVSHYDHKNNPMIRANNRLTMVDQNFFRPWYQPKIGQPVRYFFSSEKGEPTHTIFSGLDIDPWKAELLTTKGHTMVVAWFKARAQNLYVINKETRTTLPPDETPVQEEIHSARQTEGKHSPKDAHTHNEAKGISDKELKRLSSHELQEKSARIAMALAHQARSQNEKIDALTYAYLPEYKMEDLKKWTKVVSQKGTPGIIAELPATEKNLHKSTVLVSFYRISKKGKKMHEQVVAKLDEFKVVKAPQKHVAAPKKHTAPRHTTPTNSKNKE